MNKDLQNSGKKLQIAVLNHYAYKSSYSNQTKRGDFPAWQDTQAKNVWDAMKGGKEYWYVYNKQGQLSAWFLPWGAQSLNIAQGPGGADYEKLKKLLLDLQ